MANSKTRVERILEPFGATHSAGLIDFFNRVAASDFDVVIFMARKSLCIYRMMDLCGLPPIRKPIYSDAILAGRDYEFEGQSVLIVDDTLFVGTTLSDTRARLAELGAQKVQFWVYCVDVDTWKPSTFSPDYIHFRASAQEAIEFCAAECRALINAAIPYLTDFAASKRIRLYPSQLDELIKPHNWFVYDTSSQYHEVSRVKYYSAIPDQYVNEVVKKTIGRKLFNLLEIAKVRVFATWTGRTYDVTIVPIITFSPLQDFDVRAAAAAVCGIFGIDARLIEGTHVLQHLRVLQFLVGAVLAKSFWDNIDRLTRVALDDKFDYLWCAAVFPQALADAISRGVARLYSSAAMEPAPLLSQLRRKEPQEAYDETKDDVTRFLEEYFSSDDTVDFHHTPLSDLTAVFLEFHRRFEEPARREIEDQVAQPKYRNRLKRGMAWGALSHFVLDKYDGKYTRHRRNILSLVLDRLIDFGVAVPIIVTAETFIYRAYRYGEDIRFGAQEESLVYKLLQGFEGGRRAEGIEATYLEKLIVILLRVGMNEEWLNLWYSNSGRDTLVRVGFHLQGAVPIAPHRDDELIPEGESSWLTRRLCKTGTLKIVANPDRKLYYLNNEPAAAHARKDAARTARLLGHTLGAACVAGSAARTDKRPLSTQDLIVLTSCSNTIDTASALTAEVRIFADWYMRTGARICADVPNASARSLLRDQVDRRGAEAVNSGLWKFEKFQSREIDSIRAKVYALEKHDPDWALREEFWDATFAAFDRKVNDVDERKLQKFIAASERLLEADRLLLDLLELVTSPDDAPLDGATLADVAARLQDNTIVGYCSDRGSLAAVQAWIASGSGWRAPKPRRTAAQALDRVARSICRQAYEEAALMERAIVNSDRKLQRTEYKYVVWYDILDSRARKHGLPDSTHRYATAIEEFRAAINTLLADAKIRLKEQGCSMFCDTGDINSLNDEKHVFLAGAGTMEEEAHALAAGVMRICAQTGVAARLIATPTNLRGQAVFLNRGATSIDGDFKSHLHTMIDTLKTHEIENGLEDGDAVLWLPLKLSKAFAAAGTLDIERLDASTTTVDVNLRGFPLQTTVTPFVSRNASIGVD